MELHVLEWVYCLHHVNPLSARPLNHAWCDAFEHVFTWSGSTERGHMTFVGNQASSLIASLSFSESVSTTLVLSSIFSL